MVSLEPRETIVGSTPRTAVSEMFAAVRAPSQKRISSIDPMNPGFVFYRYMWLFVKPWKPSALSDKYASGVVCSPKEYSSALS